MTIARTEWVITRDITIRLQPRLVVMVSFGPGGFTAEWHPNVPNAATLTEQERRRYRRGRDPGVMLIEA